ncbi:glycoside hydrolase family 57 protein [Sulfurovum sp.]|uniref:glycoside hydrolase family 57 protein n=1 Tax=Sulfurovum sp. TaxID=1969726 RepID=UPI0025FBF532|nr:glycoside hydrolase family 57 protein [Sulfurovum sp.]
MQLAFLWHMHQPDYRDTSGIMQMPWVFLHAIKDYYDMPWMLARHSGLKATFNITPPLIEQIQLYSEDIVSNDRFFTLWMKHPSELNETDRQWMIKMCKSSPYDTMVEPIKPYRKLYHSEHLDDDALCDMEVWFLLSWCGAYLQTHNNTVKVLLASQGKFTYEQKYALLETLGDFVKTIFPYYAKLQSEGVISLSTTPLNHPILPLLIDMNNAVLAHPGTNIPEHPLSLADDAKLQILQAQALYRKTFGHDAVGFWPAEGAVDERSIALYRDAGLKWVATDEAILFKSLGSEDYDALYHAYKHNGMTIGFRDHKLSDLIGFTYRFWSAEHAADHFISALSPIAEKGDDRTVFIILDGENAWEFYHNNAFDFFDALYAKLAKTEWCSMVGMDTIAKQESRELPHLAAGSWIHGEFNTWVGQPEKTRAWELVYMTRRDYERHKEGINEDIQKKIMQHFLAAECSDWFWWYGDDHTTEFSAEFDELFRSHLINIYLLMQIAPPYDLYVPIISDRSGEDFLLQPKFTIQPLINGKYNSFFEWVGSGVVDETKLFSTMDRERGPVERIRFGQNENIFYCAFEGDIEALKHCDMLKIMIEPFDVHFEVPLISLCSTKSSTMESKKIKLLIACDTWLEFSLDFNGIEVESVQFRFEIERDGIIIQTLPGFGELKIAMNTTYAENWFV